MADSNGANKETVDRNQGHWMRKAFNMLYWRFFVFMHHLWITPWHIGSYLRNLYLQPTAKPRSSLPIRISLSELPKGDIFVSEGYSFNKSETSKCLLPPPAEVRHQAKLRGPRHPAQRVPPVRFPSQRLVVKYGRHITTEEGKCLWMLGRKLHGQVPVPRVYGWCRDNDEVSIYMEFIEGVTLEERWESLDTEERMQICEQLHQMLAALRQVEQDPHDAFVGSISHRPLQDIVFEYQEPSGPFPTVKEFHDWFVALIHPPPLRFVDPFRPQLPDDAPIQFTHGDLHRSNIIVSARSEGPIRIRAIIDWHQSGWYPAYWEYVKTLYTAHPHEDWATEYVPSFLESSGAFEAWDFYVSALGC